MGKRSRKRDARIRTKLVDGKRLHNFRVVVERVFVQEGIIEAETPEEAESLAEKMSIGEPWRNMSLWHEEEPTPMVRDCTSVEFDDGTWKFCNSLEGEGGRSYDQG